jgi:putative FmdB family regulatory protein
MPTYEYECLACKTHFDRVQKFSDPPVAECPDCGGSVRKVYHATGVVFKGSGWYITDSRKSTSSENSSSSSSSPGSSDSKSETKGESKSDTKSDGGSGAKSETAAAASKS